MNRTPAPTIALAAAGLLILTGCGADDDEQTDQAPASPEETTEDTDDDAAGDTTEDDAEAASSPNAEEETPEEHEEADGEDEGSNDLEAISHSIGDSFPLVGTDGMSTATITYEAFAWIDPSYVEGEENYGAAIVSVDATEAEEPVNYPAPIDGGGWHYLTADGEMESLYNLTMDWSNSWGGRVQHMYSGPFTPGTTESNLVIEVVAPERGGQITHVDPTGIIEAALEVPDENVNEDNESITEMYRIADEMFGGELAYTY